MWTARFRGDGGRPKFGLIASTLATMIVPIVGVVSSSSVAQAAPNDPVVVYDSIGLTVAGNVPSQAFEATSTREFGVASPQAVPAALAAPSPGTTVVTPSAPHGWYFWNDKNDTFSGSPGELVVGPATPPAGVGSVRLGPLTNSGATGAGYSVIATNGYVGTRLDAITNLAYSTFQPGPTLAIALQFDVKYRTTDGGYGGRLVY